MNTIVENFDATINFWVANPNFKSVDIFKAYYDNDKSKEKRDSSQTMWAVVLLLDMSEANVWRHMPESEKKMLIVEDFLKNKSFKWEDKQVDALLTAYQDRVMTVAERSLRNFNLKLIERQKFIDSTKYDMDNAEQLDKMIINTAKIYAQYEEITNMFKEEKTSGKTKGGVKESANEQGLL